MRLHRFYISEKIGNKTEVVVESSELANQIYKVFRLKKDDSVILFDGSGNDYKCRIVNDIITFEVVSSIKSSYMPTHEMTLCMAVTKKDTFEWVVQKATELGVTIIIPIMAERSEKKSLNMERLNKIATEASEQSGRGTVPTILEITELNSVIDRLTSVEKVCILHTDAPAFSKSEVPETIFIGPEGGWSPNEIAMFHKNKINTRSLGRQVLRAETAVISALSLVLLGK